MKSALAVISDLHVGKNDEFDIFRSETKPGLFASFLAWLRQRSLPVELVVNGDFVDFLQLRPWDDWGRKAALAKMREIVAGSPGVFQVLGEFLRDPRHRVKVLLGNHDVELAYPEVAALVRDAVLAASPEARDRFELVDRRTTYNPCINGVLVHLEHGNACDAWNAIHYGPLFQAAELGTDGFAYPPGTRFVYQTMNRFKEQFRFVDMLKPEVPAVPLLLLALRPEQAALALPEAALMTLRALGNGLLAALRERVAGPQLAVDSVPELSPEECLAAESARSLIEELGGGVASPATVATMADDLELFLAKGLAEDEEAAEPTLGPEAFLAAGADDPFARAARSKLCGDVKVVMFGHTHKALTAEFPEGLYVNSGAWANLVRLPSSAEREVILAWLGAIADNSFARTASPTYALVEPAGQGVTVSLNLWTEGGGQTLWAKSI
jgi:UDP-2,3-diacylglucosamine pyrophosphatase LpxH